MTETLDFSMPPQWVLNLYNPEAMRPHILVTKGAEPDSYLIREIDFHKVNLFTVPLGEGTSYPTKGEGRVFHGTPEELYSDLQAADAKVMTSREVQDELSRVSHVPLFFGHSTEVTGPSLTFHEYQAFRVAEERYRANPEDSLLAHNFVNLHPMFWTVDYDAPRLPRPRRRGVGPVEAVEEGTDTSPVMPRVRTGRGFSKLDFMVLNDENGNPTVAIECGPGNYHDYNLDVYAPSFDAAIVQLAKRISEHYNSHGGFTDPTKKEPNDNFFREADLMPDDDEDDDMEGAEA